MNIFCSFNFLSSSSQLDPCVNGVNHMIASALFGKRETAEKPRDRNAKLATK